jgi:hypothetical protein
LTANPVDQDVGVGARLVRRSTVSKQSESAAADHLDRRPRQIAITRSWRKSSPVVSGVDDDVRVCA